MLATVEKEATRKWPSRHHSQQQLVIKQNKNLKQLTNSETRKSYEKIFFLDFHSHKKTFWRRRRPQKKVQQLKHLLSDARFFVCVSSLCFPFASIHDSFSGEIQRASTMCNTNNIKLHMLCSFMFVASHKRPIRDTWNKFRYFWDFFLSVLTSAFDFLSPWNPCFDAWRWVF